MLYSLYVDNIMSGCDTEEDVIKGLKLDTQFTGLKLDTQFTGLKLDTQFHGIS